MAIFAALHDQLLTTPSVKSLGAQTLLSLPIPPCPHWPVCAVQEYKPPPSSPVSQGRTKALEELEKRKKPI